MRCSFLDPVARDNILIKGICIWQYSVTEIEIKATKIFRQKYGTNPKQLEYLVVEIC